VFVKVRGVNRVKRPASAGGGHYYYHRATGQRLPDDPNDPAFLARVAELDRQCAERRRKDPGEQTFAALVVFYKTQPEFKQLAEASRRDYTRYLDKIAEAWGRLPVASLERKHVLALRNRFADKPATSNYLLRVLRLLLTCAVDNDWRKDNPALRPKMLKTGEGHRPWEEEQLAQYRERWPAGTRERVAFELLLGTGQRGGDVAAMTRAHYRRGEIAVTQEKTGERVWIPVSDELREVLDAWVDSRPGTLVLLPSEKNGAGGVALSKWGLRQLVNDALEAAGLPKELTVHGLRYTAATRLAELGCEWDVVAAITGHRTAEIARRYTEKRRKARLAVDRLNVATARRGRP